MRKLLLILLMGIYFTGVYSQKIEDLPRATVSTGTDLIIVDQTDATRGISVLNFLGTISSDVHTTENFIGDTLFFIGDSTYITGAGDSIKFFVDDSGVLTLVDLGGGDTQALFDDGVLLAPSIAFLSDPNTGLWRSNPDAIAVVAGGVRGILVNETADVITTTFSDNVIITDLASANTLVLTPTSTGLVDTLETTDLATADITVTGDWVMDTTTMNTLVVTEGYNYGGAEAGGDDDYVLTIAGITAYTAGMIVTFLASDDNTGACTLNINSIGAGDIKNQAGGDPVDSHIDANSFVMVAYDGTNFVLLTPDANP